MNSPGRERKGLHPAICLHMAILMIFLAFTGSSAQKVKAETIGICDPSEMAAICIGQYEYQMLDADCNPLSVIYDEMTFAYSKVFFRKDDIFISYKDDSVDLIRMDTTDPVCTIPDEDNEAYLTFSVQKTSEYVIVTNQKTSTVTIYDHNGVSRAKFSFPVMKQLDGYFNISFLKLENGYLLLGSKEGTTASGTHETRSTAVFLDSNLQKEKGKTLPEEFLADLPDCEVLSFGDYLIKYSYDDRISSLYTKNGELVFEDISYFYDADPCAMIFVSYDRIGYISMKSETDPELSDVYDTHLNKIGSIIVEDTYDQSVNGYLIGIPYEELHGEICSGFLMYGFKRIPYAETEGGIWIESCYEDTFIPLEANECVETMNRNYLYIRNKDTCESYLVNRNTGQRWEDEEIYFSDPADTSLWLLSDGENYQILDENGEVSYLQQGGYMKPLKNEYFRVHRGVYEGITDRYGNWIYRVYSYDDI